MSAEAAFPHLDPFDLPEWLGRGDVTWTADSGLRGGHHVRGHLSGAGTTMACDLYAADEAYPRPVADDDTRLQAHQAWHHGQVHLVSYDARLTLVVPGPGFTADLVLEAIGRLAKAVAASPEHYVVQLRIGG